LGEPAASTGIAAYYEPVTHSRWHVEKFPAGRIELVSGVSASIEAGYGHATVSDSPEPTDPADETALASATTVERDDAAGELSGSGLDAEKSRRLAVLDDMRSSGTNPYPYRFDRTHTLGEVRSTWGSLEPGVETDDPVSVAGRIMLKRDSGKLVFATIRDRSGDVQLFISKAVVGDDQFVAVKALDLGDWVGVRGTVMTTRKGELSVKPDRVELLSKAIRPIPDKWHGLTDVDTRFRQRYADLIVNEQARRNFEIRHETVASFRRTLAEHGFIEVETPVLHPEVGGAHARPFTTHHNTLDMPLYLRIAVELYLKRLIVGGMERVYEIARTFRNEGVSTRHNPEFTMMELYQAFGDWNDVMDITEELVTQAARDAIGTTVVTIRGQEFDLADPWPRKRMVDFVTEAIGRELHPSMPIADARRVAADHDVFVEDRWGAGKIIEEVFEKTSESSIIRPTFVTGHPVEISPLARQDRHDPFLTERFELFVDGRELANGYSELNDPVEQRLRFEEEQAAKDAGDAEAAGVDEDYLRALEYGMPPTGGLGIGIDRLAMLLAGVDSIKEVILFPTLRPEVFDSRLDGKHSSAHASDDTRDDAVTSEFPNGEPTYDNEAPPSEGDR
jgi:lysyl-tRNA synthetase class 2